MPDKQPAEQYSVACQDVVQLVEWCHYEWCSQLLAVCIPHRITIATCRFPEENSELDDVDYRPVREIHHGSRVTALAWSPQTNILSIPKVIRFCAASADKKVVLFSSDLDAEDQKKVLGEHRSYINSLCFQPEGGELIASASDDHTCRVWSLQGQEVACLPLGAPGVSVCWHASDPGKLMVAEKKGIIRFYNMDTQRPIMSLDSGHLPLLSADWCTGNALQVAAAAATDWLVFDVSRSSRALESKQAHAEGCRLIRWCRSHDHLVATTGGPNAQIKVFSIRSGQASLNVELPLAYGLSWHHRLPLLAAGGDNKIHFWFVEPL